MMPTPRQRHLLAHLGEIRPFRRGSRRLSYRLGDEDCSDGVDALVARGMLIRQNGGLQLRPTAVAEAFLA